MPTIDVIVRSPPATSGRSHQVSGMFDCPISSGQERRWKINIPIEEKPWSVGLIVGSSGCGKTTIAKKLFEVELKTKYEWTNRPLIDDFPSTLSIDDIVGNLSSVGLSTIPAWLRPYTNLSNGEQFRADIARHLCEEKRIVIDEFSSVVDRQVAKIVSFATQKYVRKVNRQFVAISCHRDIEEWLNPDWICEPEDQSFRWRLLRQRPTLNIQMARIPHEAWGQFHRYHYLTSSLHKSSRCFGLWVDGTLAVFAGVLPRPHKIRKNIRGLSRLVCLPEWQGLGLGFHLMRTLGSAYKSTKYYFHIYPAHPSFVRSVRLDEWELRKSYGQFSKMKDEREYGTVGTRPCAVFRYIGHKMDDEKKAIRFLNGEPILSHKILSCPTIHPTFSHQPPSNR